MERIFSKEDKNLALLPSVRQILKDRELNGRIASQMAPMDMGCDGTMARRTEIRRSNLAPRTIRREDKDKLFRQRKAYEEAAFDKSSLEQKMLESAQPAPSYNRG